MNKARRQELKMLHFEKRLKKMKLTKQEMASCNLNGYRNHSCPCSCFFCRSEKFSRAKSNEETRKLIDDWNRNIEYWGE